MCNNCHFTVWLQSFYQHYTCRGYDDGEGNKCPECMAEWALTQQQQEEAWTSQANAKGVLGGGMGAGSFQTVSQAQATMVQQLAKIKCLQPSGSSSSAKTQGT